MTIPRFTAENALHLDETHYGSVSRRPSELPPIRRPGVQMALLPGHEAPGVHGHKCQPCGSGGWQWCVKTLDGQAIDGTEYGRACVPGGGGGGAGGSNGEDKTLQCALDYWGCVLGCQAAPWPMNLFCVIKCSYERIKCQNPF
jgi:hypothetical protein